MIIMYVSDQQKKGYDHPAPSGHLEDLDLRLPRLPRNRAAVAKQTTYIYNIIICIYIYVYVYVSIYIERERCVFVCVYVYVYVYTHHII